MENRTRDMTLMCNAVKHKKISFDFLSGDLKLFYKKIFTDKTLMYKSDFKNLIWWLAERTKLRRDKILFMYLMNNVNR